VKSLERGSLSKPVTIPLHMQDKNPVLQEHRKESRSKELNEQNSVCAIRSVLFAWLAVSRNLLDLKYINVPFLVHQRIFNRKRLVSASISGTPFAEFSGAGSSAIEFEPVLSVCVRAPDIPHTL
jgi:hypothetical protein